MKSYPRAMRQVWLIAGLVLVAVVWRQPFAAGCTVTPAYPGGIPQTGQTACYDGTGVVIPCPGSGQDGELRPGVSWPVPRFIDHGNGTVTDRLTGLMWAKEADLIAGTF